MQIESSVFKLWHRIIVTLLLSSQYFEYPLQKMSRMIEVGITLLRFNLIAVIRSFHLVNNYNCRQIPFTNCPPSDALCLRVWVIVNVLLLTQPRLWYIMTDDIMQGVKDNFEHIISLQQWNTRALQINRWDGDSFLESQ